MRNISSKTQVNFYKTTHRYIQEDSILHSHLCKNLRSQIIFKYIVELLRTMTQNVYGLGRRCWNPDRGVGTFLLAITSRMIISPPSLLPNRNMGLVPSHTETWLTSSTDVIDLFSHLQQLGLKMYHASKFWNPVEQCLLSRQHRLLPLHRLVTVIIPYTQTQELSHVSIQGCHMPNYCSPQNWKQI